MIMCAALALATAPAWAQSSKAGQSKGGTAAKSATSTKAGATADMAFAKEAAIGGMAEVDLGNLAKQNASSPDVKQFGDRMVTDHSKGNDELKQWASSHNVTLPTELDVKHKTIKDRLSKLNGDAFDKAYMKAMVSDHKEDVAKFRTESKSGKNADLKAWAGKTLPTLEDHLKMAEATASKVGATGATKKK
jgi:putative membrane protein